MSIVAEMHTSQALSKGVLVKVIQQDLVKSIEDVVWHDAKAKSTNEEQMIAHWRTARNESVEYFGKLAALLYHLDPGAADTFFDSHTEAVKTIEKLGFDFDTLLNSAVIF